VRTRTDRVAPVHSTRHALGVAFLEYLSHIDFGGAVLLAVALVILAVVVQQFLQVSADDLVRNLLPGAGRWIGQSAVEMAHDDSHEAWFCQTCKSLNLPGAQVCYRGCGPRPTPVVADMPEERGDQA
jgi:hypothetical protein